VAAYEELSRQTDYPLHLGVTEAGGLIAGTVKSALGIGMLLAKGIGDTMRVSLTGTRWKKSGWPTRSSGPCTSGNGGGAHLLPTCGRCRIDLFSLAEEAERRLLAVTAPSRWPSWAV